MLDLTGHMIIWGGLFAHGDGSTGLMKVVFCYALPTVVQGFGANETLHLRTTTFWVQLLLGVGCNCLGLFFLYSKMDLYVLDGNLTCQKYRDNVLAPRVVPYFDNHALVDRSMFMDDNARPHRARIVQYFLQQETVQTIIWPSMSPEMNPIEHVWDFIGQKINQHNPKYQNIDELRTAILQEWQQFPQERLGRLVRSMTRRVTDLHNKRGGYTR
jgi:transposase